MDMKHAVLSIVLIAIFVAFQMGYAAPLGPATWFVGAIVFSVILMLMGKTAMAKSTPNIKSVWMLATIFVIAITFIISFLGPYVGAVFPPGFDPASLTPLVLSMWLIVFGGAMFVTGMEMKMAPATLIGIIWIFSAMHLVTVTAAGPNSYLHFAFVTGLPMLIASFVVNKK